VRKVLFSLSETIFALHVFLGLLLMLDVSQEKAAEYNRITLTLYVKLLRGTIKIRHIRKCSASVKESSLYFVKKSLFGLL